MKSVLNALIGTVQIRTGLTRVIWKRTCDIKKQMKPKFTQSVVMPHSKFSQSELQETVNMTLPRILDNVANMRQPCVFDILFSCHLIPFLLQISSYMKNLTLELLKVMCGSRCDTTVSGISVCTMSHNCRLHLVYACNEQLLYSACLQSQFKNYM